MWDMTIYLLTAGLFLSPYSITSLREYFANGFEEYINGDSKLFKRNKSSAYIIKLESILELE